MKKVLFIDAGNSGIKWTSLNGDELAEIRSIFYSNKDAQKNGKTPYEFLSELVKSQYQHHHKVVLVSVLGDDFADKAEKLVTQLGLELLQVKSSESFGEFKHSYEQPDQLGADRFVVMYAANKLMDKNKPSNCIVIDCGTAVTIDAIDANGQHLGGLILPGLQVLSNSLIENTQQLYLNNKQIDRNILAKNTSDAISNGSFYCLVEAIKGICERVEKQMLINNQSEKVVKIICGGDSEALVAALPAEFQLKKDLVMQGLKILAQLDDMENK